MQRISGHSRSHRPLIAALGTGLLAWPTASHAQDPLPVPPADSPPAVASSADREAQLEERIRQLEGMIDRLSQKVDQLSPAPAPPAATGDTAPTDAGDTAPSDAGGAAPAAGGTGSNAGAADMMNMGGSAAEEGPAAPAPAPRFNMPAPVPSLPAKVKFGPGFEIKTDDDEYTFQFHNLTQVDGRFYQQSGATGSQTTDTFGVPREWLIFSGRMTKPFEYYIVAAEGFDNFNLLDAFLNIHFDDRIQFKIGRFKTPYTYEFYNGPVNALISPERSVFFNNFGLNRDVGMMVWGQLLEKRVDYATGIFNGTRNGFVDANSEKDIVSFINFRPFGLQKDSVLENWNFGGSLNSGTQQNPPIPKTLRTDVPTTGNINLGVPFLSFNSNVREYGQRALWSLHSAYFYKHLSFIAEWDAGFQDYALTTSNTKTNVPVQGYYAQVGYFVTGETVSSRGVLKPLHNFDLRKGKFGLGALELSARYQALDINPIVFQNGLVDPNLWTNRVEAVDVGFNWYWTQYLRMVFNWEHAMFGDPVSLKPGVSQITSDEFLIRFQVYF